jgi:hypothetical protein
VATRAAKVFAAPSSPGGMRAECQRVPASTACAKGKSAL